MAYSMRGSGAWMQATITGDAGTLVKRRGQDIRLRSWPSRVEKTVEEVLVSMVDRGV